MTSGYFTHIHHSSDSPIIEWSYDIEKRLTFIRANKPTDEIELRLACIIRVSDELLPAKWWEARDKWEEADAKLEEAYAKWREARDKWEEADAKLQKAYAKWEEAEAKWREAEAKIDWNAIHALVCHPTCPYDGHTLFAKGKSVTVLLG